MSRKPAPEHRRPIGKPTKCTEALRDKLCALVRAGVTYRGACGSVGIGESTFQEWMSLGREGREPYADFAAAVTRATAESESALVLGINKAGRDDWRALAWILERRHPDWSKMVEVKHSGRIEHAADPDYARQLDEALAAAGYVRPEPPDPAD